jgi:hypothetical protein
MKQKIVVYNPCTDATCLNGGTCFADKLRQTKCFCEEGFEGKNCEIEHGITKTTTTKRSTAKPHSK